MSTAQFGQQRSWRSRRSSGSGNRWLGRLLFSLIAAVLVAYFIYLLMRHKPKPVLQTFLVQAGSYDLDAIVPPMYATGATDRIKADLAAVETTGESEKIGSFIRSDVELGQRMSDLDDTIMVIVRGYLVASEGGRASIACSDFGSAGSGDSETLTGLVPVSQLLSRLTSETETPASFSGTRLVVLDIEPLATLPRLDQFGDAIFDDIITEVGKLASPHADRLWVLVTRGRLQNAGWTPSDQIPVSTQTLLDGIAGRADFNDDGEVHLGELCRYGSARYAALGRGSGQPSPQWMLIHGGEGLVTEADDRLEDAWISKVTLDEPAETGEPKDQQADAPETTAFEKGQSPATVAAFAKNSFGREFRRSQRTDVRVRTVAFQAEPDSGSEDLPQAIAPELVEVPPDESVPAQPKVAGNRFWHILTRLQSPVSTERLNPIAVAPHLWRKWVQNVMHAEIESLGTDSGGLRDDALRRAADDISLVERAFVSGGNRFAPKSPTNQGEPSDEIVARILTLWQRAENDRVSSGVDEQVIAADQLQLAIALARNRLWGAQLYDRQAMIAGGEPIGDDQVMSRRIDEAEQVLADQSRRIRAIPVADVAAIRRQTNRMLATTRAFDAVIAKKVLDLDEEFDRTQAGQGWAVIRRAQAWLRSPLTDGDQRARLYRRIQSASIAAVDRATIDGELGVIRFADAAADRGLLAQIASDRVRTQSMLDVRGDWKSIAAEVGDANDFEKQFAAATRIDPADADIEMVAAAILHGVVAVPKERRLTMNMLDSSRQELSGRLPMDSVSDHIIVQLSPEAKRDTTFQLVARSEIAGGEFDDKVIQTRWQEGLDIESSGNPNSIRLMVPAGKVGEARLDINVFRHGDTKLSEVPISIDVRSLDADEDPELRKLDGETKLTVRLPQKDRIRVAVKTEGMTKEMISGQDNLPGGVWLRTFSGRKTDFTFSLFNESGRACSVRAWLLKLNHPFADEGVTAYWPEVLVGRMNKVAGEIVGSDGQVIDSLLFGNQKLKGPVDLRLGADQQRTPLTWNQPPGPADSAAAAQADPPTPPPAQADLSGLDVSHGFALVIRLIDESGVPFEGQDQVIYMVPKPWQPDAYVDLQSVAFDRGRVEVSATLQRDIDGDQSPDIIPEIVKSPVVLGWTEDPTWESFQPSLTRPLDRQIQELKSGLPSRGKIEVPVAQARESIVQLDVDDWPRAILRTIQHLEGASPGKRERFDQIRFSAVTIDYGDDVPSQSDDDDPIESTKTVSMPDSRTPVIFRGRAKSLMTRIAADLTTTFYAGNTPPEVTLSDDSRFWTDRIVRTVAEKLDDKGNLKLVTSVDDIEVSWNSAASRPNDQLNLRATLKSRETTENAAVQIVLDSTPPEIDTLRRDMGRVMLGSQVQWNITGSDPPRNGAFSGLDRIVVGLDKDGDGKPDSKDNSRPFDGEMKRRFNAPDAAGSYRLAVQVWDKAGLASEGRFDSFQVYEPIKRTPPTAAPVIKNPDSSAPPATQPATPPPPPKKGTLAGKIDIGSTLRGTLTLSPVPNDISPADGILSIGSARPAFSFKNVPEGTYTLTFEGTQQGTAKTYSWSGLTIDKQHSLPAK